MFEIDVLFKQEYARLVAVCASRFGAHQLEAIEDAVQESFYKALKLWPANPPENPRAWLARTTQNHLLDRLKSADSKNVRLGHQTEETLPLSRQEPDVQDENEIRESQLKMLFACCHPELSATDQLILNLKFNCGFGTRQIARALMKSPAAIEKATTRARQRLQQLVTNVEIPAASQLQNRVEGVMKALYLQFSEGYKASEGAELIKKDICLDAIANARQLAAYPALVNPQLNALIALMYFQASRLDSRIAQDGTVVTLQEQDRNKWNHAFIRQGNIFLGRSSAGGYFSNYHIEAVIASHHAIAASYNETNWASIARLYDMAYKRTGNPHYLLNGAIAQSHIAPAAQILALLENHHNELPQGAVTHIFKGDLLLAANELAAAEKAYVQALELATNEPERAFIASKLAALQKTV